MVRYYLCDILNDSVLLEVKKEVYEQLEDCVFNKETLQLLKGLYSGNIGDLIDELYYHIKNSELSDEIIYSIIKIGVD